MKIINNTTRTLMLTVALTMIAVCDASAYYSRYHGAHRSIVKNTAAWPYGAYGASTAVTGQAVKTTGTVLYAAPLRHRSTNNYYHRHHHHY